MILRTEHPALTESRTIHVRQRVSPNQGTVIKRSTNSKIGKRVKKGKWRGLPIYTVTLEERATCPNSCPLWRECYGNNMRFAHRMEHGPKLERQIQKEIAELAKLYPGGFVVRLHVLGDFYSIEYVRLWKSLVRQYPELHVFGYTHVRGKLWREVDWRTPPRNCRNAPRWLVRHSDAPGRVTATVKKEAEPGDFVCPEQTGKVAGCGDCALCWNPAIKDVVFLEH